MDFLLELEIEILYEIKRDGITSFTDFVAYFNYNHQLLKDFNWLIVLKQPLV